MSGCDPLVEGSTPSTHPMSIMMGTATIYWLKELQWAREQILKAKTTAQKQRAIEYHKAICDMSKK